MGFDLSVDRTSLEWANGIVTEHHYLHRPVHPRASPFAYAIHLDGSTVGTIIMATPHFTRQTGLFGYPGLPTKWQVLVISRVWINPKVQNRTVVATDGKIHSLPVASAALSKMLKRVQYDWLEHHPPRFLSDPYHIRLILAYADTGVGHTGVIYQAANFERFGVTKNTRKRHSTRGTHNGEVKILYVFRLALPTWTPTMQLSLF